VTITTPLLWVICHPVTRIDSLIVSIKFEQDVVCAVSNVYIADDLG